MLTMIRSLGGQLRWASELELPVVPKNREFVVAGMGGSGISGDFVGAITLDSGIRVTGHKGYGPLPGWADESRPLVIGVSYSGNTEETIDVVGNASERGLDVAVLTTGGTLGGMAVSAGWPAVIIPAGLQPRAALGYLFGASLRLVGSASGQDTSAGDLLEAADVADRTTTEGSEDWAEADQISTALIGRTVIVYGGGVLSGVAAQRWKTQINENAKMPAWWSVLPELNHNEIVGWETIPAETQNSVAIVGLSDVSDHERVPARFRHTRELIAYGVPWAGQVSSRGSSAAARMTSLAALGDVMSWMLAEKSGVDPVPVGTIEKLKRLLVEETK